MTAPPSFSPNSEFHLLLMGKREGPGEKGELSLDRVYLKCQLTHRDLDT